jgi:hypothetical protein
VEERVTSALFGIIIIGLLRGSAGLLHDEGWGTSSTGLGLQTPLSGCWIAVFAEMKENLCGTRDQTPQTPNKLNWFIG